MSVDTAQLVRLLEEHGDAAIAGVEIGEFRRAVAVAKDGRMFAVLFPTGAHALVACLAMPRSAPDA